MAGGIRFQDRDLRILAEIGELGLLDTNTIRQRHFANATTAEACAKKLRQYADLGLIDTIRPPLNARDDDQPGGMPAIHRLTQRGADELETRTSRRPQRPANSDPPKLENLLHRLGTVKTRLAIDDAFARANLPLPQWWMEFDTNEGAQPKDRYTKRYVLYEQFHADGQRFTCWADAAARLRLPGEPIWELLAYVEYDRSTMTKDEIAAKMPGYHYLLSTKAYRKHWPKLDRYTLRVLFVCPSARRVGEIADAIRSSPAAKVCRLVVERDLLRDDLLTAQVWQTVDGELRSLLKALPTA